MSETTKIIMPEGGGNANNGMLSLLASMMGGKGIDPNLLLTMNKGGFGNEGGLLWVIFLFFLMGWGRNGWGGYGGGNGGAFAADTAASTIPLASIINNDNGRELLMSAIQGNGAAVNNLATTLNCSVGQVQSAINALMGQVQNVANATNTTGLQVINAIQAGNCQLANQLASCCCEIKTGLERQGYENRIATAEQTNAITGRIDAQSQLITAQFNGLEMREMQNKLDALRERNAALQGQLSQEHQTAQMLAAQQQVVAPVNAALADLSARLAQIECKQPATIPVPYSPITAVPNCVAAQYGLTPYGVGGAGFWG